MPLITAYIYTLILSQPSILAKIQTKTPVPIPPLTNKFQQIKFYRRKQ